MKDGRYEGTDIQVFSDEERKAIDGERFKVAAAKQQSGFMEDSDEQ